MIIASQIQRNMKHPYRLFPQITVILLLIFSLELPAQTREYSDQIVREFPISNAATVDITNKYGMVQVMTWEKDSVKFTIDLQIQARDNDRLEKLKKEIDFDFNAGQYFLIARTVIGDGSSDIIRDIVDIASTYFTTANKVAIDYTVFIPDYTPIKIENKYGDVYIDDLESNLNLNLAYGDLKSNDLKGRTEISISSGDGDINYIRDGQLTVAYSDLEVNSADKLLLESRSSNITIDNGTDLRINSSRDKIYLGETVTLAGESYFSDLQVEQLRTRVNYRMRYGNLVLENVLRSFAQVSLTSELTDVELIFEQPMSFQFEMTHHEDVRFIYPQSRAKLSTAVVDAAEEQVATTGSFGSGSASSRVLIVASRKCDVIISSR